MSKVETPLREVRLQVAACFVVVMLSIDALNPIKFACGATGVPQEWVAWGAAVSFLCVMYANANDLVYFFVKVFFHSVLSIFFTSMETLGINNIPLHGPIIFAGNHMNQFVDGSMMMVATPHHVSFLVAQKSYNERVVGDFAKLMGAIPVARPQDHARPGPGTLVFDGLTAKGKGTQFTQLGRGEKLRPGRSADVYKVKQVISDTEALLAEELGEPSPLHAVCQVQGTETSEQQHVSYDIIAYVDQGRMFDSVQLALSRGACLGIFPEGGSHDNTDLLPLKVGVAAIALGVMEKYGVSVPIVPVGLTYFRGDRFRGRVLVEYGEPVRITKDLVQQYKENKRVACQSLLSRVEEGMRSVLVTATDYNELKLLHTVRRLYQRSPTSLNTHARQDLSRRFSVGLRLLKDRHGGTLPADALDLQRRVLNYQEELDHWGLKDYQVPGLEVVAYSRALLVFLHGFTVFMLASLPSLVLNAPVGYAAKVWAEMQARKDLLKSRVKVQARDVILSKKIMFCLVGVPVLWALYSLLLFLFSPLTPAQVLLVTISMPLFSYFGVTNVEAGMVRLKDIRPFALRLLPQFKKAAEELPEKRAALVADVRALVRKYGPELGAVYYEKSTDWDKAAKKV